MNEVVTSIEEIVMRISEVTTAKLEALRDSQMRTDQRLAETNDRLNVFVNVSRALYHERP